MFARRGVVLPWGDTPEPVPYGEGGHLGRWVMRLSFGRWYCAVCGAVVEDVPEAAQPRSEIRGTSGQPTVRVVLVGRREVHRCEVGAPAFTATAATA